MALVGINAQDATNETTPVTMYTVVGDAAALAAVVQNADTGPHTYIVKRNNGSTNIVVGRAANVEAGSSVTFGKYTGTAGDVFTIEQGEANASAHSAWSVHGLDI